MAKAHRGRKTPQRARPCVVTQDSGLRTLVQSAGMDRIKEYKVIVIGSGPAGCTAAIYLSRANLAPLVLEGLQPGGQLTITTDVENYPGFPEGVLGPEMMEKFKAQAERFGTVVHQNTGVAVDLKQRPFTVTADDDRVFKTQTLIIATGASAIYLGLPNEQALQGRGVSA